MNERRWQDRETRRMFLNEILAGSAVVTFGAAAPQILCHAAAGSRSEQRVLVVVEMAGGNDGLNTIVPYANPDYRKARPTIGVATSDVLAIDSEFGMHPAMRGLVDLLESNRLAIVQGVGYENPNRSHFESMDIWHTCRRKGQPREDGWIGRYLDYAKDRATTDPPALHLGSEQQPLALRSRSIAVPSIQSLDRFQLKGHDAGQLREWIRELSSPSAGAGDDLLGFVRMSTQNAVEASERIDATAKRYRPAVSYPSTRLGEKLRTIAQLITAGLQSRVYYVRIDGFDTHANQPDAHAGLLREVSNAIFALVEDLTKQGHGDRVLVMGFSEFGRRVAENASDGTDHGTAGPVLLAGHGVQSGLIGTHPSLADLIQGDLKYRIDFRQVYATVLEHWLETDSVPILGARWMPVAAIRRQQKPS